MTFTNTFIHFPDRPLSDLIDVFWYREGHALLPPGERSLPDGSVELVISLYQDSLPVYPHQNLQQAEQFPGSLIYGAHSEYFLINTTVQIKLLGIHFKPGGAFPFLNIPMNELQNAVVPLEALWGQDSQNLREQLLSARTPDDKFSVLERVLLSKMNAELHPAITYSLKTLMNPAHTITTLSDRIGLSSCYLRQLFNEQVGLTPKTYARIQRFHSALSRIERAPELDWTQLALDCGYFDQAHFIHDFKAFSGITPGTYLNVRSGRYDPDVLTHIPLDT